MGHRVSRQRSIKPRESTYAFAFLLLVANIFCDVGCRRNSSAEAEKAYVWSQQLLKENKTEAAMIELKRAIQLRPEMAKAHRDLAALSLRRGDLQGAYQEYSAVIQYNPQDQEAYRLVAEILLTSRNFANAKEVASKMSLQWPSDLTAKRLLAESMMGLGDWENARKLVEQNTASDRDNAQARFDLAKLMVHDKDWGGAERELRIAWSLDPKILASPLILASLLEAEKKPNDAEEVLRQVVEQQQDRTEPLFALAGLYIRGRRLRDAENVFKKIQIVAPKDPRSRSALGEFYRFTGNAEAANQEFQRIVAENPEDRFAWHRLAEVKITLNQRDEARHIASELLKKNGKDWESLTLLGILDLEDGKINQSEQELAQAKDLEPEQPVIHFHLARVYIAQGKVDLAKAQLTESLNHTGDYPAARVLLGELELRAGQADLAVQDLSKALERNPTAVEPNVLISQAYALRGQFDLAQSTLSKLLEGSTTPTSKAMTFQSLAQVKFQQRRYNEAALLASKSLGTGVLSPEALLLLGLCYLAQNRPDQALKEVVAFVATKDDWSRGQEVVGEIAMLANNLEVAEKAYLKALTIKPDSSTALFGLGNAYERHQMYDKAADCFHRLAVTEPGNAMVHVHLGTIAEHNRDWQQAASEYQNASKLDAQNAFAKNNLAWIYAEHQGDLNVALGLAQEARRLQPTNPNIADTLGWILVKMNLGQNAVPYLKETVAKNPDRPVYHYHLGMAYLKAGRKSEARNELRAALRSSAAFSESADAKEALKSIPQ